MPRRRLLFPSLLILMVFPFCLAWGQTASDIPPDQETRKAVNEPDMDVRDPPKPDGIAPIPQGDPANEYCDELKREGVAGANLQSYCK